MDAKMSKKEFERFSMRHDELQMERESDGTILIMPVHGGTGKRENKAGFFVRLWQYQTGLGEVYGSTTGFDLPDGSTRMPDTAWLSDATMATFTEEEEENEFIPAVPDFVIEIRSSTDRLGRVKDKMNKTWMKNGVRLAWLIDPYQEKVYIFRPNEEVETIEGFTGKKLRGEDLMPGMELPLDEMKIKKHK